MVYFNHFMQWMKNIFIWILIIGFMILAFNVFSGSERDAGVRTPINTVLELAKEGKLKEVKIKDNTLVGITTDGQKIETGLPSGTDIVSQLIGKGVRVEVAVQEHGGWWLTFLVSWLPILLLIGIWIYMMRQVSGGGRRSQRKRCLQLWQKQGKGLYRRKAKGNP
jgi:cell division protease FtsH